MDENGIPFFDANQILHNIGITWSRNTEGSFVHEDIDLSKVKLTIAGKDNKTTVSVIYEDEIMVYLTFDELLNAYTIFPSDFLSSLDVKKPQGENPPPIIRHAEDTDIKDIIDGRVLTSANMEGACVNVLLPQTFPEDSYLYNSGFIYENFISVEDFFPVIMLRNDKFREKGWKLDLRFSYEEVPPVAVAPPETTEPEIDGGTPAPP